MKIAICCILGAAFVLYAIAFAIWQRYYVYTDEQDDPAPKDERRKS